MVQYFKELTPQEREKLESSALKYLDTDLLCYRAPAEQALHAIQNENWNAWRQWFEEKFSCELKTTMDLVALHQDKDLHDKLKNYVQGLSSEQLRALQTAVVVGGSLVLAVAFIEKEISAEELFYNVTLEESYKGQIYNEELYGQDPDQERKFNSMKEDLKSASKLLA